MPSDESDEEESEFDHENNPVQGNDSQISDD